MGRRHTYGRVAHPCIALGIAHQHSGTIDIINSQHLDWPGAHKQQQANSAADREFAASGSSGSVLVTGR